MDSPEPIYTTNTTNRVEIHRIGGDIYVNNTKIVFAVDFDPSDPKAHTRGKNVDWLLDWVRIGMLSRGHIVPTEGDKINCRDDTRGTEG